jgi:dTMP kinase
MAALGAYLRDAGLPVRLTREPGGTPIGDAIRAILLRSESSEMVALTELFLYQACRAQHIHQVLEPALHRGELLLCDRFTDATLAYQGYGRGLGQDLVHRINEIAASGLVPDLTVLLDCPVELGLQRSWQRLRSEGRAGEESRFEEEAVAFHRRVREGYLEIARQEPLRVKVVDGRAGVDAVQQEIRGLVMPWVRR